MPEPGYLAAVADELSILVGSITDEHLHGRSHRRASTFERGFRS
jgi:hypothetical protein